MDDADLGSMEKALLANPFDEKQRLAYANALFGQDRYEDAVAQYDLLLKANDKNAAALTGIARCRLALGNETQAMEPYLRARNLEGFVPVEELERIVKSAQAHAPTLSVVKTGADKVTSIHRDAVSAVRFADVAGMESLKKTLRLQIIEPFRNPGLFSKFRKSAGGGVLLYGPPGCGKTLIARAIATECRAEFISVGISDVLNMWIGESERNLAALFERARSRAPSVLFFDELDALAFSRSKSSSSAARTVVNEFLSQLDGFSADNKNVMVLAATNMPWDVDPAMKRPGRFSRQVFVPPPDAEARLQMLRRKLEDIPSDEIDVRGLAEHLHLYSGADIDGLLDIAKDNVLAEIIDSGVERKLATEDLRVALEQMTPSTIEWLQTARNLVKFSGPEKSYRDVEKFLKTVKML